MKDPSISIVTVTYNAVDAVEATILSVLAQHNDDCEYIIIDGDSKDGTQAVVNKYLDKIDIFVSEPDKGIPDALNKAVKLARGKYVLFILAGDRLIELPYKHLVTEDADLVCFPVLVSGNVVHYPEANNWLKIKNTIPHQGAFFRRNEYLIHDNKYRFFCDFALCQLYYINNRKIKVYDAPVVAFHGLDGATSNKKNFHEVFSIIRENYGSGYRILSYLYWKYCGLRKRIGI